KKGVTLEDVASQLERSHGNLAAAARSLGYTREGLRKLVNRHPSLGAVLRDCREAMKDDAESALYAAALRGEAWAVCFFLKCQAKDRGYVERTETREVTDDEIDAAIRAELARLAQESQAAAGGAPRAGATPRGEGVTAPCAWGDPRGGGPGG